MGMTSRTIPTAQEWMRPAEAAAMLGVTTRTMLRLAADDQVHHIRPTGTHYRYLRSDVERLAGLDSGHATEDHAA